MISNEYNHKSKNDLQSLQSFQLKNILNLNKDEKEEMKNDDDCVWKIIIYDKFCQDVLSTLFKVGHLRDENVTLHLNLNSFREKVHGVKSIYFLQPTEENLKKLNEDFSKDLYDSIYINFAYSVSSEYLEKLAGIVVRNNAVHKIRSIFQNNLNFVCLSNDFFTLNIHDVFSRLNRKSADLDVKLLDYIAESLFCVFRCMKMIPYIIYRNSKIGLEIKKRLEKNFAEYTQSKEFEEEINESYLINSNQPFLFLFERNIDYSCVLLHPWHYGSLVHDLLEIRNNKVELNNEITNNIKTEYDLDNIHDKFWAEKMNKPFPYVSEDIDKELNDWKTEYDSMGHKKLNKDNISMSENLASALDQVTDMTERKRRIDLHTNIATHLLNEVKNRQLDKYFELGSAMLFNKHLNHQEKQLFLAMMQTESVCLEDKARLLMLYYICVDELDLDECLKIEISTKLKDDVNLNKALTFVKKEKNIVLAEKNQANIEGYPYLISSDNSLGLSFLNRLADKVKTHGKGFLKNVQTSFSTETNYHIPKIFENFIENRSNVVIDSFLQYDPLSFKNKENKSVKGASDLFVFMIDGASYNEYQNFSELSKKINKRIIYGGSNIYNAKSFIKELSESY